MVRKLTFTCQRIEASYEVEPHNIKVWLRDLPWTGKLVTSRVFCVATA